MKCTAGFNAFDYHADGSVSLGWRQCELDAGHEQEMHERHDERRGRQTFAAQQRMVTT